MVVELVIDSDIVRPFSGIDNTKSIRNKNEKKFILNPYSNRLSSLIRLIEITSKESINVQKRKKIQRAVCVCLYIDKNDKVFYSNNIKPNPDYKDFENEGFLRDIPSLKKIFIDKENISFSSFNEVFKEIERKNFIHIKNFINMKQKSQETKKIFLILKEFYEEFYNKESEIKSYFFDILNLLEESMKDLNREKIEDQLQLREQPQYLRSIASTINYIKDCLNVNELIKGNDLTTSEELVINSIKNKEVKRADCQGNKNVHCEMRMWEHISKDCEQKITKETFDKIKKSIEEERFIVSKFCCGYCGICFSSWENTFNMPNKNSNTFEDLLGITWSFFSGWISPSFLEDKNQGIFNKTKEECSSKLLETESWTKIDVGPLIENSEIEHTINQVLEFI